MSKKFHSFVLRLLFACLAFSSSLSRASWDYSAGLGARSLPVGGAFNGQIGWNQTFWGDSESRSPVGHGLVRPSVRIQTSGLTTSGEAKVGFYPIPILGVNAGWSASYRNISSLHTLSCELYECRGLLSGRFVQPRAVVGWGDFFWVMSYRLHQYTDHVGEKPFAEERSTLAGAQGGDTLRSWETLVGYRLDERDQVLALWSRESMQLAQTRNQSVLLAWRHQLADPLWKLTGGLGLYESSTRSWGPAVAFMAQWTPLPSAEWF